MKILHTSDWHLGKNLEQFSRLEEQEQFLLELNEIVKNKKIDLILVAGDIYDTVNPQAKAEQLFYKYINKINDNGKIPIILIAGNHDSYERIVASNPVINEKGIYIIGKYDDEVQPFENDYFKITDTFVGGFTINIKSIDETATIITMPFPTEKNLNEIIDYTSKKDYQLKYSEKVIELLEESAKNYNENTINILMAHIFAQGGITSESERDIQIGGAYVVEIEKLLDGCDYIALGHMHQAQQLKKAMAACYYSGSPIQYSKSEAGKAKSVYIIDIDEHKNISVEKEFLSDYKSIEIIKAKSFEEAKEKCELIKNVNCYVYFELDVDSLSQTQINELKKIVKNVVNIQFENSKAQFTNESIDFETMKVEEVFKEFYKRNNKGLSANEEIIEAFSTLLIEEELDKEF